MGAFSLTFTSYFDSKQKSFVIVKGWIPVYQG